MRRRTGIAGQVSRSELAQLAGVRRATVTMWAKRHKNFPPAVWAGGQEYLDLASAVAWLDSRPIPESELRAGEEPGRTYGQRVRNVLSRRNDRVSPPEFLAPDGNSESVLRLLLEDAGLRNQIGESSAQDYVKLLLCLVFLRCLYPDDWRALRADAEVARQPADAFRMIGEVADDKLRALGMLPGMTVALEQFQPRSTRGVPEVLALADRIGPEAFGELMERFGSEAPLGSTGYFTPKHVARLMADLVVQEGVNVCYDPYLRGGELLKAVAATGRVSESHLARGESPHRDTLRLAGMSLAVGGLSAELRLGSVAPWDEPPELPERADVVLTNPPFNARSMRRIRPDGEWLFGPPPPDNDNYAWLQHVVESLAPDGNAAVLMPNQAAVSSQEQEYEIRRQMIESGGVLAVIALPPRIFSSTPIAVSLWVVRCPLSSVSPVLFTDAVTTRGPVAQQGLASAVADQIIDLYHKRTKLTVGEFQEIEGSGLAVLADIDSIRRANYSLNPLDYMLPSADDRPSRPQTSVAGLFTELADHRTRLQEIEVQLEEMRVRLRPGSADYPQPGWQQFALHELCEIQAGPSYTRLRSDVRTPNGSVPVVMPRHLRDRRIVAVDTDKVTGEIARELANFQLAVNDIVCVRAGSMGDPALVEQQQAGWLFGTNLLRLRIIEPEIVAPHFLLGVISSRATRDWIRSKSSKTAIPSISTKSLGKLTVALPPLSEQADIGPVLSALDQRIAAHQDYLRAAVEVRNELADQLATGVLGLR